MLLDTRTNLAPFSAKSFANSRPMPLEPPVIRTVFPLKSDDPILIHVLDSDKHRCGLLAGGVEKKR
jgi:hypothetical protein